MCLPPSSGGCTPEPYPPTPARCAATGRCMLSSLRARSTSTSSQGATTPQPWRLFAGREPTARGAAARCLPASTTFSCRGSSSAHRCSSRLRSRAKRRSSFWRCAAGPTTSSGRSSLIRRAAATMSIISTATSALAAPHRPPPPHAPLQLPLTPSKSVPRHLSRLTCRSQWHPRPGRSELGCRGRIPLRALLRLRGGPRHVAGRAHLRPAARDGATSCHRQPHCR
jgi:hypothetical protein